MSTRDVDAALTRSTREFFAHFFRAYPRRSALMVALLVLGGIAEGVGVATLVPLLELAPGGSNTTSAIGRAIARALATVRLEPTVPVLLGLIVVAMSMKALFVWLAMTQVGYTVARVTRDLRLKLVRTLLDARWSYFGGQQTGSFANAVSSEAHRSALAYLEACTALAGLVQVGIYAALSALISWRMTLVALVAGGLLTMVLNRFIKLSRQAGADQTRLARSLASRLVDVVQGVKAIKAMAREHLVLPLLEQETESLNRAMRRQVVATHSRAVVQEPLATLLLALALFFSLEVGGAPMSTVLVLAFVFYRLIQHINQLQAHYQTMVASESAFWSIQGQISRAAAAREHSSAGVRPEPVQRGIALRSVSFSHSPDRPLLRELDLEIPAGSFIVISGESGIGKTTLADLVVGLHQPLGGEVLIDGIPLSQLSQRRWRQSIGYVPQELLLFNDSIARNVTLGDSGIPRTDVERALRLAGAWEFVSERPKGMDAEVGDKGGMFSGGQRQRIAIARALVHRPSVLVLDEVTTALDPETEREICRTLRSLAGQLTILSISHQPAMREMADRAYSLRNGVLVREPAAAGHPLVHPGSASPSPSPA